MQRQPSGLVLSFFLFLTSFWNIDIFGKCMRRYQIRHVYEYVMIWTHVDMLPNLLCQECLPKRYVNRARQNSLFRYAQIGLDIGIQCSRNIMWSSDRLNHIYTNLSPRQIKLINPVLWPKHITWRFENMVQYVMTRLEIYVCCCLSTTNTQKEYDISLVIKSINRYMLTIIWLQNTHCTCNVLIYRNLLNTDTEKMIVVIFNSLMALSKLHVIYCIQI